MPIISRAQLKRPAAVQNILRPATIRDFSGLWNVSDSDLNLKTSYSTIMANIERGTDGAPKVRYGYREFADVYIPRTQNCQIHITPDTNKIVVDAVDHGLLEGSLVKFTGIMPGIYLGLTDQSFINFLYVQAPITDNSFSVLLPQWTGSGSIVDLNATMVEKTVEGNIIACVYFEDYAVYVTDKGHVGALDAVKNLRTLWLPSIVLMQTLTEPVANAVLSTVSGSNVLTIDTRVSPAPVKVGDVIELSLYTDTFSIPAAQINRRFYVDEVIDSKIKVQVKAPANTTGSTDPLATGTLKYSASQAWSQCDFVSHSVANRQLTFCNGIDKPIVVDFTVAKACSFLVDPSTGSNINTPVGKYIASGSGFTVIAGILETPGIIQISASNTNNTWQGDVDSDGTSINISKLANTADPKITGVAFHQSLLFVTFNNDTVIIAVGVYKDDLHTPQLVDVVSNYGCIAHKAIISVGKDFYVSDYVGIVNMTQNTISGKFSPARTSELITPDISKVLSKLTNSLAAEKVWSLYDKKTSRIWLFVPSGTGYRVYVYVNLTERKASGWQLFTDMDFTCGTRTTLERLLLCKGNKIYIVGNDNDPITDDDGDDIRWVWELPWIDFDKRLNVKNIRYVSFDTKGSAEFNVQLFVDRIYEDLNTIRQELMANPAKTYDEYTLPLLPDRQQRFAGADRAGYGVGEQGYGGGARTSRAKRLAMPTKCNIVKLRASGVGHESLRFSSISFLYQVGSSNT